MTWTRSLRSRIGLLLAAAALPAAAVSIVSAIKLFSVAVEVNNAKLRDNAMSVAQRVEDEISEAGKLARLLALVAGDESVRGECAPVLRALVENFAVVTAAAVVDADDRIACSIGIDRAGERALLLAADTGGDRLTVDGSVGALSVEVPQADGVRLAVAQLLASPIEAANDQIGTDAHVGVIDETWAPVAGSVLPAGWKSSEMTGRPVVDYLSLNATFDDEDGTSYRLAVAPILQSDLFAYAYVADSDLLREETAVLFGAVAAPLLTIAFAIAAAWIGIDRLAIRWIVYLRRLNDAYGAGRASVRASHFDSAPAELYSLGEAFNRMADAVTDRTEAARREAESRGLLLRELHHRIKNNFQLVTSLVSLQKREAPPSIAAALATHERRVGAIAAAYRVSYADGEVGPVGLGPLFAELREIIARHADRPWAKVTLDLADDLPALVLDRAIPTALLVTKLADERISSAPKDRGQVLIVARRVDDAVVIEVEGGVAPSDPPDYSLRLRRAFAMQLGATDEESADGSRVTITIPVDPDEVRAL